MAENPIESGTELSPHVQKLIESFQAFEEAWGKRKLEGGPLAFKRHKWKEEKEKQERRERAGKRKAGKRKDKIEGLPTITTDEYGLPIEYYTVDLPDKQSGKNRETVRLLEKALREKSVNYTEAALIAVNAIIAGSPKLSPEELKLASGIARLERIAPSQAPAKERKEFGSNLNQIINDRAPDLSEEEKKSFIGGLTDEQKEEIFRDLMAQKYGLSPAMDWSQFPENKTLQKLRKGLDLNFHRERHEAGFRPSRRVTELLASYYVESRTAQGLWDDTREQSAYSPERMRAIHSALFASKISLRAAIARMQGEFAQYKAPEVRKLAPEEKPEQFTRRQIGREMKSETAPKKIKNMLEETTSESLDTLFAEIKGIEKREASIIEDWRGRNCRDLLNLIKSAPDFEDRERLEDQLRGYVEGFATDSPEIQALRKEKKSLKNRVKELMTELDKARSLKAESGEGNPERKGKAAIKELITQVNFFASPKLREKLSRKLVSALQLDDLPKSVENMKERGLLSEEEYETCLAAMSNVQLKKAELRLSRGEILLPKFNSEVQFIREQLKRALSKGQLDIDRVKNSQRLNSLLEEHGN